MFYFFKKLIPCAKGFFARAAKTATGQAAGKLSVVAEEVFREAQSHPDLKSGSAKFKWAKGQILERFPSFQAEEINLAIELAVAVIKEEY